MHASPSSTPAEDATAANGTTEMPREQTPELAADAEGDAHMADVEAVEGIVDLAVNGVADAVNNDTDAVNGDTNAVNGATDAHPPPSPPSVADDEHKPALLNGDVTFPDVAPDVAPTPNGDLSLPAATAATRPAPDDSEQPPPAKRARRLSDTEASLVSA
jgi:hypothetical protein